MALIKEIGIMAAGKFYCPWCGKDRAMENPACKTHRVTKPGTKITTWRLADTRPISDTELAAKTVKMVSNLA